MANVYIYINLATHRHRGSLLLSKKANYPWEDRLSTTV